MFILFKTKIIVADARKEIKAKEFQDLCERRVICLHHTAVDMPKGNGYANRSLLDAIASMGASTINATHPELILGINLRSQDDRYIHEDSDTLDANKLPNNAENILNKK